MTHTEHMRALRAESAALDLAARDMHAAGVVPETDLDIEPVQRRLIATRSSWGASFYHVHQIVGRVLDLRARAAEFPDRWAQQLAERRRRRGAA